MSMYDDRIAPEGACITTIHSPFTGGTEPVHVGQRVEWLRHPNHLHKYVDVEGNGVHNGSGQTYVIVTAYRRGGFGVMHRIPRSDLVTCKGQPPVWGQGPNKAEHLRNANRRTARNYVRDRFGADPVPVEPEPEPEPESETEPKLDHGNLAVPDPQPEGGEIRHRRHALLQARVKAGMNVYLWGPTGTGKSQSAMAIAKDLGMPFGFTSRLTDHYGLAGYMDAQGEYVETEFYRIWTGGGVFLQDEVDRSNPSAVLWLNAALANGECAFPCGTRKRHPDCIIIATGNTQMNGADVRFNGGVKQDGSVAERFAFMSWDIDERMEAAIAHRIAHDARVASAWTHYIRNLRTVVAERSIKACDVSPRATFEGLKEFANPATRNVSTLEDCEEAHVQRNIPRDTWVSILSNANVKAARSKVRTALKAAA